MSAQIPGGLSTQHTTLVSHTEEGIYALPIFTPLLQHNSKWHNLMWENQVEALISPLEVFLLAKFIVAKPGVISITILMNEQ